jgi:hypothetical protein
MKSVLFAALLATLSPVQAGHTVMEDDCASRPYVGVCPEVDSTEAAESQAFIEPKTPATGPDCNTHPYVGVCDEATGS